MDVLCRALMAPCTAGMCTGRAARPASASLSIACGCIACGSCLPLACATCQSVSCGQWINSGSVCVASNSIIKNARAASGPMGLTPRSHLLIDWTWTPHSSASSACVKPSSSRVSLNCLGVICFLRSFCQALVPWDVVGVKVAFGEGMIKAARRFSRSTPCI